MTRIAGGESLRRDAAVHRRHLARVNLSISRQIAAE